MERSTRIPRRAAGLLERDTGDAVVVMAETGDVLHTLQGTALFIWKRIDGVRSTDAILADLTKEYEVDPECAAADMEEFLRSLSTQGLMTIE